MRSSSDIRPDQKEPGTLICLPICSSGFFRSGSASSVMGCCFLARLLAFRRHVVLLLLPVHGARDRDRDATLGECYSADVSTQRP